MTTESNSRPSNTPSTLGEAEPVVLGFDATLDDLAGRLDSLIQRYTPAGAEGEAADSAGETLPEQSTPMPIAPPAPTEELAAPHVDLAPDHEAAKGEAPHVDRAPDPNHEEAKGEAENDTPTELAEIELESPEPKPLATTTTTVFVGSKIPDELKSCPIMIVDDEEVNILTVRKLLKQVGFDQFITCSDSRDAIPLMLSKKPDVVLLDLKMPEVHGMEILRLMSIDNKMQHIPAIVLTAARDPLTKRQALDLGVNDFLTKPVDPNELTPRVRNALVMKKNYDAMASQAARLEEVVKRRTEELFQSRKQLILSLARAAEHRDNDTGNHVIRVGRYAAIIASELGWSREQTELIEQAAQLHDVGKIGVPDAILFKPGKLEPREFELMKKHCSFGQEIIQPLDEREFDLLKKHVRIGQSMLHVRNSPMLMMASRIAQTHHEWWDGTGYPLGLAGDDIPLVGRITAIADVFDALSSKRPYKEAFPREKCFAILEEGRGAHFDPDVLDAFFVRSEDIIETQLQLMDRDSMGRAEFLGENSELFPDKEEDL